VHVQKIKYRSRYDNGTYGWAGKIKFGAPQVVDMGIDLEHSPDGKFYIIGHGAVRSTHTY